MVLPYPLRKAILTVVVGAGLSMACTKEDDPDAVDVENLKYPSDLRIVDNGDGAVQLSWRGGNFEDDFEGYNVYGMKFSDSDIEKYAADGLVKGSPLLILNAEGEPRTEAKEILANFNYNGEDLDAAKAEATDDGEKKIAYLPIHTEADDDPVLPTCYPKDGVCETTGAETELDDISLNGTVTYSVTGLTPGDQYCFLIFSVQDGGKEISGTSSEFQCVTPMVGGAVTIPNTASTDLKVAFDIRGYATACATTGTCPTLTDTNYFATQGSAASVTSTENLYMESRASNTSVNFIAGVGCGLLDLGYSTGFADPLLRTDAPEFDSAFDNSTVFKNGNGYSVPGQDVRLNKSSMVVLACEDGDNDGKYFYDWIYIKGRTGDNTAEPRNGVSFDVELRLAASSR